MRQVSEGKVDVAAWKRDFGSVRDRESWIATGGARQETVQDVDEPEGSAEGLIPEELVRVGVVRVQDAEHVEHTSCLTEKNVGTNSVPRAPFVDDQETERLNISQAWVVKVALNQLMSFGGVGICRIGRASMTANQGWRAPIKTVSCKVSTGICMNSDFLPSRGGQKTIDKRRLERSSLEVLDEGRLMECDTSWECFGDDPLALGDELRGEPGKQSC